jgi:hypothetical protein
MKVIVQYVPPGALFGDPTFKAVGMCVFLSLGSECNACEQKEYSKAEGNKTVIHGHQKYIKKTGCCRQRLIKIKQIIKCDLPAGDLARSSIKIRGTYIFIENGIL